MNTVLNRKLGQMPDLAEFMTTQEAADKLGFHTKSIPQMISKKRLDGIRFGRAWLVSKKSVQEYLDKTSGMSKNDPRRKIKN
jgi:excisionase family DNA binding protein